MSSIAEFLVVFLFIMLLFIVPYLMGKHSVKTIKHCAKTEKHCASQSPKVGDKRLRKAKYVWFLDKFSKVSTPMTDLETGKEVGKAYSWEWTVIGMGDDNWAEEIKKTVKLYEIVEEQPRKGECVIIES